MKRMAAILILAPAIAGAQNLVTNATMEETNFAAFRPRIEKAEGWSNANGGTADLFVNRDHACSDGIPSNYMGTQDGSGGNYAGIIAYYGDQRVNLARSIENGEVTDEIGYGKYTEYLEVELTEPLKAGQIYNFSYKASLAENSDRAVKGLGAYISADKVEAKSNSFLNVDPQVINKNVIDDMNGWTEVSGTFIAHGGERYVVIGAFPQYLTVADVTTPNGNDSRKAYYYIADPVMTERHERDEKAPITIHTISSAAEDVGTLGERVILDLHFTTGSAELHPGDVEKLNAVVRYLGEHPDVVIKVDGHTDAIGNDSYNQSLSERRALTVKYYLTGKGVSSARIKASGYGEKYPVEHTAYESAKNRRIELYRVE